MSAFKNNGVGLAVYEYDFAVDGGATGSISLSSKANCHPLPSGCVITKVLTQSETSFTGAGASASVGNTNSTTVFMAAKDVDGVTTLGLGADQVSDYTTALVAGTNKTDVVLAITGGAVTAGKLKVFVQYLY